MAVSPTGALSLPLYHLQTLLANSASFQTAVGATGTPSEKVTAARARIYLVAKAGGDVTRPFALIAQGDDWEAGAHAGGAGQHFATSGSLYLVFEDDIDAAHAAVTSDAEFTFTNLVGACISEMEALAGSDGYLAMTAIRKLGGPVRSDEIEDASTGDFYRIGFEVAWGVGA